LVHEKIKSGIKATKKFDLLYRYRYKCQTDRVSLFFLPWDDPDPDLPEKWAGEENGLPCGLFGEAGLVSIQNYSIHALNKRIVHHAGTNKSRLNEKSSQSCIENPFFTRFQ